MRPQRTVILLLIVALFLGGCAPTLPQTREDYVKAHPNLDPKIKEAILQGQAVPGMTPGEVRASCGTAQYCLKRRGSGEILRLLGV